MNAARRVLWSAGLPARSLLIGVIRLYRLTLSGVLGGQCRFHPSCSVYAEDAVRSRGAAVGTVLAAWRVLRCNPFGAGGVEPVPVGRAGTVGSGGPAYDVVTRDHHKEVSA